MRILFYTNSYAPDPVGIAFYNTEWVAALAAAGHTVEVLTAFPYYPQWKIPESYDGRWRSEETIDGVRVTRFRLYVPKKQTAFLRFLCELSFMLVSLPALWLRPADCIIAVSPPFGVSLAAALVARGKRRPLWLHVQDLQIDAGEAVGFLKNWALLGILRRWESWTLSSARELSTITARMRDRLLIRSGASSVSLFPNWVDENVMRPLPKISEFRREQGWGEKFVVLYSGSLGIHQGFQQLLLLAERLQDKSEILFVIAGNGHAREMLAEKIARRKLVNVQLLPLQPKSRLCELLSSADIGLVMEIRQMANLSMPSKIWNQMACGRPILAIASPESAVAQIIGEALSGVVVSPGNTDLLAMTLLDLLSAPQKVQRMGDAGRAFVTRFASKQKILAELPTFLDRALRTRPRRFQPYFGKRALDVALALAGFAVSLPLWLLIPLTIWSEDRGPIFFKQARVGKDGKTFYAYKFRSMHRMELPQHDRRQARRGDPRVTRAGRWLRRTAMDEVPQLWNILRGDMSFVGPRALMPSETEVSQAYRGEVPLSKIPGYQSRIEMCPGLTGIAQVFAARDVSRRNKFRYDALYRRQQSLWLDVGLILRSGWNSLAARWERVGSDGVTVRPQVKPMQSPQESLEQIRVSENPDEASQRDRRAPTTHE